MWTTCPGVGHVCLQLPQAGPAGAVWAEENSHGQQLQGWGKELLQEMPAGM